MKTTLVFTTFFFRFNSHFEMKSLIFGALCGMSASLISILKIAEACNHAVCGSVVSKCMLTQSCNCDLKTCSCCQECFACLSYLYSECCSCLDMCPKPDDKGNALGKKSHVEDFQDPVPDLFQALTAEVDTLERWDTFVFPVDIDISIYGPEYETEIKMLAENSRQVVAPQKNMITLNCTVAYMSHCMSWNKCKSSCQATGASKYRWFHDGCCECIGHTCISYGINESRCAACPVSREDEEEDASEFQYDTDIEYFLDDEAIEHAVAEAHLAS